MKSNRKTIIRSILLVLLLTTFGFLFSQSSKIARVPYPVAETKVQSWDEIFSSPKAISIQTYKTGLMQTELSGIMNLDHERATDIKDELIDIPVNVWIIHHEKFGSYLIDAGLDASYVDNPYGGSRGILVKKKMGRGSQEPGSDIAAILKRENIRLKGVWLTHLHPDHTAGIVDLPKDIPYVVGKGEQYINIRFFFRTDHLKGLNQLFEIDFNKGIDLVPFGKCVDLFGDGSFWAIESGGHSKGHVMYLINGKNEQVLLTGDACNDRYQFDTGIGPGNFSSDREKAQEVLDKIIIFKEKHPEQSLFYGHDL